MDRYYYTIEQDKKGNKLVHILANVYSTDGKYECAEWSFMYLTIEELHEMLSKGTFYSTIDELCKYVQSYTDITEIQKNCIACYIDSNRIEMTFADITIETPVGSYWCDNN